MYLFQAHKSSSAFTIAIQFGGAPASAGRRVEDSTQRRGSRLNAEFEMVPNTTPVAEPSGRRAAALKKETTQYTGTGYANLATPTQATVC